MKKIINKNSLFGLIIGGIIFSGVGVVGAVLYNSTQVKYNDTNVQGALDELYTMVSNNSDLGYNIFNSSLLNITYASTGSANNAGGRFSILPSGINLIVEGNCWYSYDKVNYIFPTMQSNGFENLEIVASLNSETGSAVFEILDSSNNVIDSYTITNSSYKELPNNIITLKDIPNQFYLRITSELYQCGPRSEAVGCGRTSYTIVNSIRLY